MNIIIRFLCHGVLALVRGLHDKCSVERVRYVINNFITLGHCEIWSHFTRTWYFYSPSARDNTVATREISRNISR